jgi:hypothetical protein
MKKYRKALGGVDLMDRKMELDQLGIAERAVL